MTKIIVMMRKTDKTMLIIIPIELHKEYKELCKNEGFNMSQRIRNFIESEISRVKVKNSK
jgi:predicted DNA-binding protein